MAGWLTEPTEAVHVGFGNVLGEDRKMMRSRAGDSVKLADLLDEAVERAAAPGVLELQALKSLNKPGTARCYSHTAFN